MIEVISLALLLQKVELVKLSIKIHLRLPLSMKNFIMICQSLTAINNH